jgi:hypothetical protein
MYFSRKCKSSADVSIQAKGGSERSQDVSVAEGFEQALDSTLLEQVKPHRVIGVRRDEDDRNRSTATIQLTLQIGSRHVRHGDIEDQAARMFETVRLEELFRR